jgi:hypothetical protein
MSCLLELPLTAAVHKQRVRARVPARVARHHTHLSL